MRSPLAPPPPLLLPAKAGIQGVPGAARSLDSRLRGNDNKHRHPRAGGDPVRPRLRDSRLRGNDGARAEAMP